MLFCCFSFPFWSCNYSQAVLCLFAFNAVFSVPLFPQRRSSSLMGASWRPEKLLKRICWWFTPNATLTDWRSLSHLISLQLFIWKIFVHDAELPLLFVDGSFVHDVHVCTGGLSRVALSYLLWICITLCCFWFCQCQSLIPNCFWELGWILLVNISETVKLNLTARALNHAGVFFFLILCVTVIFIWLMCVCGFNCPFTGNKHDSWRSLLIFPQWSLVVATITEIPPLIFLPNFLVQRRVLRPLRTQTGGTIMVRAWAQRWHPYFSVFTL